MLVFHKMLDIMKEHGSQSTKDLAVKMISEMLSSNSEKGWLCYCFYYNIVISLSPKNWW